MVLAKFKRWKLLSRTLLVSLAFVVLFAWMDVQQLKFVYEMKHADKWVLYQQFSAPAILVLWYGILLGIALVYYLFTRDKSESVSLFAVPAILLFFGLEDLLFFVFSPTSTSACMSWFNYFPHTAVNWFLGQDCTSLFSLVLSVLIGVVIAWFVYKKLKRL